MLEAPRPYTVPALANRWQCDRGTIYRLVRTGQLRSFRFGEGRCAFLLMR